MFNRRFGCGSARGMVFSLILLSTAGLVAQPKTAKSSVPSAPAAGPASTEDLEATREQLFKLLRVSPKLTQVIEVDPSLLGDSEYVARTNPELAQFLQTHPQIVRSPEFYLFADGGRGQRFQRRVWPELGEYHDSSWSRIESDIIPFLVFLVLLGAVLWVLRVVLESRRWGRLFKVQTEVYNKLLEKFSSNEELLNYVRSEAGKRFLDSAALPLGMESRVNSPVNRILTPLQIGVVTALTGLGFLYLRNDFSKAGGALLVFGTMGLMLGLGFIISAGLAWGLARHLGLMPSATTAQPGNGSALDGRGPM